MLRSPNKTKNFYAPDIRRDKKRLGTMKLNQRCLSVIFMKEKQGEISRSLSNLASSESQGRVFHFIKIC